MKYSAKRAKFEFEITRNFQLILIFLTVRLPDSLWASATETTGKLKIMKNVDLGIVKS